jgi:hypothetical protein
MKVTSLEPNEEAVRAHPPKTGAGLMSYRQHGS